MAARPSHAVGRLAVERARVRMPGLAPDSVEVVELARGEAYAVLRSRPAGILVLDERGRVVRGRERLAAIGRHVRTLGLVRGLLAEARVDLRAEEAERSLELLSVLDADRPRVPGAMRVAEIRSLISRLRGSLELVQEEERRGLPPTERTLRRTTALFDDAARADRRVVRAVRLLASDLAAAGRLRPEQPDRSSVVLLRWILGRLERPDMPFALLELDEPGERLDVAEFVAAARR